MSGWVGCWSQGATQTLVFSAAPLTSESATRQTGRIDVLHAWQLEVSTQITPPRPQSSPRHKRGGGECRRQSSGSVLGEIDGCAREAHPQLLSRTILARGRDRLRPFYEQEGCSAPRSSQPFSPRGEGLSFNCTSYRPPATRHPQPRLPTYPLSSPTSQ